MEAKELKYLGFSNSWDSTPQDIKNCINLNHNKLREKLEPGNRGGMWKLTCKTCGYYYVYDTSD